VRLIEIEVFSLLTYGYLFSAQVFCTFIGTNWHPRQNLIPTQLKQKTCQQKLILFSKTCERE